MQLRAMIDESMFPALSPQNLTTTHTSWPNLELLDIMFHNARQDGTWYFSGSTGEGQVARDLPVTGASYPPYVPTELDEEMDERYSDNWQHSTVRTANNRQFRIAPDANLIPLLERLARAATQMPILNKATIWSPINGSDIKPEDMPVGHQNLKVAWGIIYTEPERSKRFGPHRRLEWSVGNWRPDKELHSLFQEIGRAKHGDELTERWSKSYSWAEIWTPYEFEKAAGRMFSDYGKCV
ncbi:hypothetical protein BKA58DRAFT_395307 [Alternaria rosae]|uniref:uncharacterized protein n=1 Tax=Alternaria rosae TaxID=1187941 RepID=UPI001E8E0EAC|nr:uncharacterized protein BKA58DRAFT_395307 [Alternaria rosae]KAH6848462.1 hypothetical protein BKA58DRAFT_395307 [Alternaria rosae]